MVVCRQAIELRRPRRVQDRVRTCPQGNRRRAAPRALENACPYPVNMRAAVVKGTLTALVGVPLALAVVVMGSRVGDDARFVTWPVVAFTAVAAVVALVGVWAGPKRTAPFAAGVLAAVVVSYFLLAAPVAAVALVVVASGAAAALRGGMASGFAAGLGALVVLSVVLQGPAVECGTNSVSANSGPWWIKEPRVSSASGTAVADAGTSSGTTEVGGRRYEYVCADGRLNAFQEAALAEP